MRSAQPELLVIGGGSGGLAAARRAAKHGARVSLVERELLGGTCVNVGCVPKKVMWHAAGIAETLREASGYGYTLGAWSHDWATLVARRRAYIARLNDIYRSNLEKDGIELIQGDACFEGADTVRVGKRLIQAQRTLIATGGAPARPSVPGAELGIDSDGFFALDAMPARVTVVGSGYIAVELAGMLQALGAEVRMLIRRDRVLREFDAMLGDALLASYRHHGMQVQANVEVKSLSRQARGLSVELTDGSSHDCDELIWAIGRNPASASLQLQAAGVVCDASGFIKVDEWQQTSNASVFAVGDVTGCAQLTPVAIAAGRRLSDRLYDGQSERKMDYTLIPSVVFSHPAIGTVGLSEAQARERYGSEVSVYQSSFRSLYYGVLDDKLASHMKLVCVGEQQRVVGCHLFGPGSDEMLQGFAVAIRMGACKKDLDETVAIHPTCAEELVTMT